MTRGVLGSWMNAARTTYAHGEHIRELPMTDVPNRELVVYVLSLLGAESRRVHTEEIAVKCHELFPASFSWTKYTQLPDKDIVRVALTDARKAQHGALVDGRSGERRGHSATTKREPVPDGWMLTEAGVRWVREHRAAFETLVDTGAPKAHRQKVLKDVARVRKHPLFLAYLEGPSAFKPSIGEIADFVRCRVDAPENVWLDRFQTASQQAILVDQQDVVDFLTRCRSEYMSQR